jgi:lysophospholipase
MANVFTQPIEIPNLILQAQADTIVCNQAQTLVHNKMPLSKLVILENGKHELLCETDEIRLKTLLLIYQFCGNTDKGS